jgi:hypothetical protein
VAVVVVEAAEVAVVVVVAAAEALAVAPNEQIFSLGGELLYRALCD